MHARNKEKLAFTGTLLYREEVKLTDREVIRDIVSSSGFFSPAEIEMAIELVDERLARGTASGYHFLFVEHSDRVIGYTCFGPVAGTQGSFNIYWIAVRNDFRGLGVGERLLAKTEKIIAGMGGRCVYIDTSSRELYVPTRLFYFHCGYQQEAVLKDFYSPGDSKIIFSKKIYS